MPTKPIHSIASQLNAAQVAISNALADARVVAMLSQFGYTAAKIKEGQKLYQAARLAVNAHKTMSGEQQYKTSEVKKITKNAYDAYQALAKVARAIWQHDKPKLAALGLHGAMPRSTAGFLNAAYTLFDNAAKGEAAADKSGTEELAEYGYTRAKLAAERAKITALDRMNQAQEAAKGEAQNAGRDQQAAIRALNQWLAMFTKIAKVALRTKPEYLEKLGILARSSKTKAQRQAPKKARETRAKKKAGA
jgi:hypothetical protein